MKRDALTPPKYPVAWNEFGLTGNVWGWIYWWYRNGRAYADGQPTVELRKHYLKRYHEVHL